LGYGQKIHEALEPCITLEQLDVDRQIFAKTLQMIMNERIPLTWSVMFGCGWADFAKPLRGKMIMIERIPLTWSVVFGCGWADF